MLFVNVHEGRPPHAGAVEGCDVPYRCLLPRGVDNLLVVGRGAAYVRRGHDPTGMRARPLVMVLGQAAGVAATLAIESNTTVKGSNAASCSASSSLTASTSAMPIAFANWDWPDAGAAGSDVVGYT